jgi:hypothetical protein
MKTITKKEALALYHELTELAHGFANALGTTPDKCNDPICVRWRKLEGVLDLEDGMLLLLTDEGNPIFILIEYHITGNEQLGGIMSVEESIFDSVERTNKVLTVDYKDGGVEFFVNFKNMPDVYYFHSAGNRYQEGVLVSPYPEEE